MPKTVKASVEYITENDLAAEIKQGAFSPCYLFFGEEFFLTKTYILRLKNSLGIEFPEFNLASFDGNAKIRDTYAAATSFPMMSAKKAVVLCDFDVDKAAAADFEVLLDTVRDAPPTTCFIICFETVVLDRKKLSDRCRKLFEAVSEVGGKVACFERKTTSEIARILQKGASSRKAALESNAAYFMVENCSGDLGTLVNELEKLCVFVGGGGTIGIKEVETVCARSTESSVYSIADAILQRDLGKAYSILDDLLYMNTEPALIISIMSQSYIDLYRAFAAKTKGVSSSEAAGAFGYGRVAFRFDNAMRRVSKFSERTLKNSLKILSECDREVKASRTSPRVSLEKAIASLVREAGRNG